MAHRVENDETALDRVSQVRGLAVVVRQGPALMDDRDIWTEARVLIVDDSEPNILLLNRILRRTGVEQIFSTTDPRRAVEMFREHSPDLVLLDLQMPFLDGFEVMKELQELIPEDDYVPVLVLTADDATETKQRALTAGANDFLTKPFDQTEVILRARNLLHTRAMHTRLQRQNARLEATVQAHDDRDRTTRAERREQVRRITEILTGDVLGMVYQPIIDLDSGIVVGEEALARFDCEPRQTPDVWFAEAADVGLAVELELLAIRLALEADIGPDQYLSLNASPTTAAAPALHELLGQSGYDRIVLEITEHAKVADYDALREALEVLRANGVRLAVDDAGAGFASLQHILLLRPEVIKLDISLTRGIDSDPVRRALALALVSFANELGATIVAEGIETAEEMQAIQDLGVRCGQGYYLGRPAPHP